jgi:protein-S-isoprenylcysteine O-methyltransferase Ste14
MVRASGRQQHNDLVPAPLIALSVLWVSWWLSWLVAALWRDRAAAKPPRRQEIAYRLFAVTGFLLLFGPYRHALRSEGILWHMPGPAAWLLVGVALAGFAFTWWARLHLGRLWSSSVGRKAGHHIIDSGPYGIVRHPIYTGITLATMATAAVRGTLAGWAGVTLLTIGWVIKARLEEAFLREQLGAQAYDAYARRVPMLVPFLR